MKTVKKLINLEIHDAEKEVYKGDVMSISSLNATGPSDILPQHSNFISIIFKQIIFIEPNKKKFEVKINKAVLKCEEGKVDVYIGIEKII